jgi:PhnO protein
MAVEQLTIRLVRSEDILDIYSMVCDLENCKFDRAVFKSIYQKNIASDNNVYLIAIVDSIAIGFLSCHGQHLLHHEGMVYEIHEMYVDPSYRNNGIGELLMNGLKQQLKNKNIKSLEVTSNVNRELAHRFYLKQGFKQSHYKFTQSAP